MHVVRTGSHLIQIMERWDFPTIYTDWLSSWRENEHIQVDRSGKKIKCKLWWTLKHSKVVLFLLEVKQNLCTRFWGKFSKSKPPVKRKQAYFPFSHFRVTNLHKLDFVDCFQFFFWWKSQRFKFHNVFQLYKSGTRFSHSKLAFTHSRKM